jgi:hypothetical protein
LSFRYDAECEIWAYSGKGGWHFATLPADLTAPLKTVRGGQSRAWGSMRVEATIGGSSWTTSLFPDSKSGCFLLPVKAAVRKQEGISAGDLVRVIVKIAL